MVTTPSTLPPLTEEQRADARATYASLVISGTSLSEERAMEIAREYYASDVPARIAALPPMAHMSYEQMTDTFQRAGLLKG